MKKKISILFVFILLFLIVPFNSNAQTLGQFKQELDALEKKELETQKQIKLNKEEKTKLANDLNRIYSELDKIIIEIMQKESENIKLEAEINEKDKEIKKIISSYQVSNGNSFYIEYLFGADSITDFIMRYSISEQLTQHNDKLIEEMNLKIDENIFIRWQLKNKEVELNNKQIELKEKRVYLEENEKKLDDVHMSVLDEIANTRKVIKMYEEAGCKDHQLLKQCAVNLIPMDTGFLRPLANGYVTSEFTLGIRTVIDNKGNVLISGQHLATDISSGQGTGAKVYSVANGKVVYSDYLASGGNYICIHHNINGIGYTSCYAHLHVRYKFVGDIVTKNDVIGLMGNTGLLTTGPHVHFQIGKGLRYSDNSFAFIDPRTVLSFPSKWGTWTTR